MHKTRGANRTTEEDEDDDEEERVLMVELTRDDESLF
jgi:hypothetical protein